MRLKWTWIIIIAIVAFVFLAFNIYGLLEIINFFKNKEHKRVLEWKEAHKVKVNDDFKIVPSTEASIPVTFRIDTNEIKEEEEEDTTVVETTVETEKPTTTTTTTTTTTSRPYYWRSSTWTPLITKPTTSTARTSQQSSTVAPRIVVSTTLVPETTVRRTWTSRTWIYPSTRKPELGVDDRKFDEKGVFKIHHESTTTTEVPTTTRTTSIDTTTTRITVTTPRYSTNHRPSSPYERITIPATSSYREPYIHRFETSSRIPISSSTLREQHQHRHHHHHNHNRTHIEVHSHHHYIPPSPPDGINPFRMPVVETTTEAQEEMTTRPRHHHHHNHHHHHHHNTTTTSSTTSTTTTTTTEPTTTTETVQPTTSAGLNEDLTEEIEEEEEEIESVEVPLTTTTQRARQRQPEPTIAPLKSEERDVTIVTGLINIGRGDWWQYRRPLEKYHEFMENVLSLKNKMVIFVDDSSYDFVHKYRKNLGLMDRTRVHRISMEDIPLYGYINEAKGIIDNELNNETFYREFADSDMKTHPEAKSAEYNIVVNSKTHFLHNVTIDNPFDTEHFIWLDAGYGHGNQSYFPYNNIWRPKFPDGKISLIKLTPFYDKLQKYSLDGLYRKNWAVLSGGFIAGDKHSIGQMHHIIHRKFIQLIYQKYVDDDQTLLVLAANAYPHLFNIVQGDWFDAFRLFSVDAEAQLG